MRCPTLSELPPPPPGKTGWPWTEESLQLPDTMPDGRPWPKISIVTPNYNYGRFLEETIRSVLLQGYPNLEYIIIDGGSTDNSVEIIKKYEPWLAYWVSEPDQGQAHAINKGFQKATGEILSWLNSDDLLFAFSLQNAALSMLSIDQQAPVIGIGRRVYVDQNSIVIGVRSYSLGQTRPSWIAWGLSQGPMQESSFFNRVAWEQRGPLSEELFGAFDLDFFLRVLSGVRRVVFCRGYVGVWRLWEQSKCTSASVRVMEEVRKIRNKYRQIYPFFRHSWIRKLCRKITKYLQFKQMDGAGLPNPGDKLYAYNTDKQDIRAVMWHLGLKVMG